MALVEQGVVIASAHHSELNRHAEETLGLIERVLAEVEWPKESLDRVACSVGPGSFTGVRVGLSLASGIGMGLDIAALGLGSLRVVAAGERMDAGGRLLHHVTDELTVVLRDARRDEFFLAVYDHASSEVLAPMTIAQHTAQQEVEQVVQAHLGRTFKITRAEPDAKALALLAAECVASECPLTPQYIRDAGATPQNIPVSPLLGPRL